MNLSQAAARPYVTVHGAVILHSLHHPRAYMLVVGSSFVPVKLKRLPIGLSIHSQEALCKETLSTWFKPPHQPLPVYTGVYIGPRFYRQHFYRLWLHKDGYAVVSCQETNCLLVCSPGGSDTPPKSLHLRAQGKAHNHFLVDVDPFVHTFTHYCLWFSLSHRHGPQC